MGRHKQNEAVETAICRNCAGYCLCLMRACGHANAVAQGNGEPLVGGPLGAHKPAPYAADAMHASLHCKCRGTTSENRKLLCVVIVCMLFCLQQLQARCCVA